MAIDFYIKQNDTEPEFCVTISKGGTAVNLTGATVRFFMIPVGGSVRKINGSAATITGALTGQCEYRWAVGDTDTPGRFYAEFEVTFSDGKVMTAPNDRDLIVRVVEDIGPVSTTTSAPTTTVP